MASYSARGPAAQLLALRVAADAAGAALEATPAEGGALELSSGGAPVALRDALLTLARGAASRAGDDAEAVAGWIEWALGVTPGAEAAAALAASGSTLRALLSLGARTTATQRAA
jgi:Ala-tRNA(Pro) deacylase